MSQDSPSTGQFEFRCQTCGERHVGLPAFSFSEPAVVSAVPPAQRASSVCLSEDACTIEFAGTHFFVRAQLEVPIVGTADCFTWGIWGSLSQESFTRYLDLFDKPDRTPGETFFSWLSTALPEYPDTMSLKGSVQIREYPQRPGFLLAHSDHPLAVDQHHGIDVDRAAQLAGRLLHDSAADRAPDAF